MTIVLLRALLAPLLTAALAGMVTLWSWRGRRVNDHPACRRCGYDLSGSLPGSHRCPECGSNLFQRRATRHGVRVRRSGLATASILLLVASCVYGSARG